jgi:hypothetical protein
MNSFLFQGYNALYSAQLYQLLIHCVVSLSTQILNATFPKRRLTLKGLHILMSQKSEPFITTLPIYRELMESL